MQRLLACWCLCFGLLGFMGCGKESAPETPAPMTGATPAPEAESGDHKGHNHGDPASDPQLDTKMLKRELAVPKRDSFNGRWLVSVFHVVQPNQSNTPPTIGELSDTLIDLVVDPNDPTKATGTIVASRGDVADRELRVKKISATSIELEFYDLKQKEVLVTFEGQRGPTGRVIGSMLAFKRDIVPVRLIPTEERTFARIPQFIPFDEQSEFLTMTRSAVPDDDAREFNKNFPESPLGRLGYLQVIQLMASKQASEEDLNPLIEDFLKSTSIWGQRLRGRSFLDVCQTLVLGGYEVTATEEWLSRADKELADHELGTLGGTKMVSELRQSLRMRKAMDQLGGSKEEIRAQGRELAVKLLQDNLFNPILLWKLADEARESKRIDEALRYFAELAVMPGQEDFLKQQWAADPVKHVLPSERVAQLWKEKHGKADGVDAYLNDVYFDTMKKFAGEAKKERTEADADQVVLLELFTGARCPQCVSADLALAAAAQQYPSSMVVALRYHEHIPGADPLANEDTESRLFNYYRRSATPTVAYNGKDFIAIGGPLVRMTAAFNDLKKLIDADLAKKAPVKLEATAVREGDVIKITCAATGEKLDEGRKRLRVVLAESRVDFKAANGVRQHDMVVRQIVSTDKGIEPADGAIKFEGTVDVAKLKASLADYLQKYETGQSVEFGEKPLDLKSLMVVAFVQDDENKVVLQTIAVPVK